MGYSSYTVLLCDQFGNPVRVIGDYLTMKYTRGLNRPGGFMFRLPPSSFDRDLFQIDRRIQVYRHPSGGRPRLDFEGLIDYVGVTRPDDRRIFEVQGMDFLSVLQRFVVTQYNVAGTLVGPVEGYADDLMIDLVLANIAGEGGAVASIGPRLIGQIYAEDKSSGGEEISLEVDGATILTACQDAAQLSAESGTPLYFDMVRLNKTDYLFRVSPTLLGVDLTTKGLSLVTENGQLTQVTLAEDHRQSFNTAQMVGGQKPDGTIQRATYVDTDRAEATIWSRRERSFTRSNILNTDFLENAGRSEVRRGGRRTIVFDANVLVGIGNSDYGVHWDLGDRIFASIEGIRRRVIVDAITITMQPDGTEQIDVDLR